MSEEKELILLVDDEDTHLDMFARAIEVNDKVGKYNIQKARTVSEALKYVVEAAIIVLDANFPNDINGSKKPSWQEVIDAVNDVTKIVIYPNSSERESNLAIEEYITSKGGKPIIPNGKRVKDLIRYLKTGVVNQLEE